MPGQSVTLEHLFMIRWDTIEYRDVGIILRELRGIREKTGRPVIYVAIQDDDYREPSAEVKQVFKRLFPELMKLVKRDYVVIRATGMEASIQRSLLKAMIIAGRIARIPDLDRVVVLDTFEEVLRREAAELPAPVSEILTELRQKGLLRSKVNL